MDVHRGWHAAVGSLLPCSQEAVGASADIRMRPEDTVGAEFPQGSTPAGAHLCTVSCVPLRWERPCLTLVFAEWKTTGKFSTVEPRGQGVRVPQGHGPRSGH